MNSNNYSDSGIFLDIIPFDANEMNALKRQTIQIMGMVIEYKDLMMMYTCAIKEIKTKFDVLNTEFEARYSRNPINSVHTRLKSTASIMQKLSKLS